MKKVLIIAISLFVSTTALMAQQALTKLGHINSQEILQAMPERVQAEKDMEAYRAKLEATLKQMSTEYESKVVEYQGLTEDTPASTIENLQKSIVELENRIQQYQVSAEQDLLSKQNELLQPMLLKVQEAIDAVGKENGFAYIFDISTGTVVYKAGEDVGVLVKKKLGLM